MISTTYLNLKKEVAAQAGAEETAREITYQPKLWLEVLALINAQKEKIETFLKPILEQQELRIILTGAGSSAFIGEATQGIVQQNTGRVTQALATTDLVTHPDLFFLSKKPTLLISFARSGNSPESVETVRLADEHVENLFHFIITCNEEGHLAHYAKNHRSNTFCLQLPEKANDKSLAMTGSFTSMLLSVILVTHLKNIDQMATGLMHASDIAENLLNTRLADFEEMAEADFERVVFLGSGPQLGVARECHLKLQELTDGQVICKHDSFLGFRHGPRAVLNEKTMVIFLFSPDPHVYQYEKDLALSISGDYRGISTISFGADPLDDFKSLWTICSNDEMKHSGPFHLLTATLTGQLLGFYKSIRLGLQPDNPSVSGAISRVVQGVKIYHKA